MVIDTWLISLYHTLRLFLTFGSFWGKIVGISHLQAVSHQKIDVWTDSQRTPDQVNCDRAIKYSGLGVRSVGPVGDFLDSWEPRNCVGKVLMSTKQDPHLPAPFFEPGVDRYLIYWRLGAKGSKYIGKWKMRGIYHNQTSSPYEACKRNMLENTT